MRDLEETLQGINLIHQLAHKVLISCQRWISLHVLIDASIEASGHEGTPLVRKYQYLNANRNKKSSNLAFKS